MEEHEDAGTADREKTGTVMNGLVQLRIEKKSTGIAVKHDCVRLVQP